MKSKILGVCGGNGVILHPFRDNLVGNLEPRAIFTTPNDIQWKLNFKVGVDRGDDKYSKSIDCIIGAPDCGHSSVFAYSRAKQLGTPGENYSLNFFFSQVLYYKPKVFMMENLPKLLDNLPNDFEKTFADYNLVKHIQSVSVFGNSQVTRIRLVLVGIHKDFGKEAPYCAQLPYKTYELYSEEELLRGLPNHNIPELCHIREPDSTMVCMIYKDQKKISVGKARELWNTEYKDVKKWPVNQGNLCNQPGVYRNFADDYPLTVRKQNRQFNHNGYMLSPREMARIQGVPDSFKLWYDEARPTYCINKARATVTKTPPYEIGIWFNGVLGQLEHYF